MGRQFRDTVTKWAIPTIRPPTILEPIRRPHSILDDKPQEDLAFWGPTILPNVTIHWRVLILVVKMI
jgi:hypothetical protein